MPRERTGLPQGLWVKHMRRVGGRARWNTHMTRAQTAAAAALVAGRWWRWVGIRVHRIYRLLVACMGPCLLGRPAGIYKS